jgi:hypothetical protein
VANEEERMVMIPENSHLVCLALTMLGETILHLGDPESPRLLPVQGKIRTFVRISFILSVSSQKTRMTLFILG